MEGNNNDNVDELVMVTVDIMIDERVVSVFLLWNYDSGLCSLLCCRAANG